MCRAESMTLGDEKGVLLTHKAKGSKTLEDFREVCPPRRNVKNIHEPAYFKILRCLIPG